MQMQPNFQVTLTGDPMAMGIPPPPQPYSQGPPPDQPPPSPNIVRFDPQYIKTNPGRLKILELVNCAIGFLCIQSARCSSCSNSNWYSFVVSSSFFITGILLVFYLTHLIEKLKFMPWHAIELFYTAIWTLFYMIAALVVSVKGARDDAWAAAGFFGFAGAILYAGDCYLKFKYWKNGVPAQGEKPISPSYAAY